MEINDLDISHDNTDFIITGGKDCKVKVWLLSELLVNGQCFAEFNEHQQEVTAVAFSKSNSSRAYSASTDKQIKVYDLSSKICIKTISTQSPVLKMIIDMTETNVYAACDNQNIYCYSLEVQPQSNQIQGDNAGKNK